MSPFSKSLMEKEKEKEEKEREKEKEEEKEEEEKQEEKEEKKKEEEEEEKEEKCPLCRENVPKSTLICKNCGSLEGILFLEEEKREKKGPNSFLLNMCQKPQDRLFGFDWAKGTVAPFVGASSHSIERALEAANVREGDRFIDLGCGDGRACLVAAKRGAEAVGCDLDEELLSRASLASSELREMGLLSKGSTSFLKQDLMTVSLQNFQVIYMFLLPETLELLSPRLKKVIVENQATVLSILWPIPLLEPYLVASSQDDSSHLSSSSSSSSSSPSPSPSQETTEEGEVPSIWFLYSQQRKSNQNEMKE